MIMIPMRYKNQNWNPQGPKNKKQTRKKKKKTSTKTKAKDHPMQSCDIESNAIDREDRRPRCSCCKCCPSLPQLYRYSQCAGARTRDDDAEKCSAFAIQVQPTAILLLFLLFSCVFFLFFLSFFFLLVVLLLLLYRPRNSTRLLTAYTRRWLGDEGGVPGDDCERRSAEVGTRSRSGGAATTTNPGARAGKSAKRIYGVCTRKFVHTILIRYSYVFLLVGKNALGEILSLKIFSSLFYLFEGLLPTC